MAATHSIVGYSLVLETRYARGEKQSHVLAPMPNGDDMLVVISGFLEGFAGVSGSDKDNHFGEVTKIERRGRTIGATMKAGKSGLESDIIDPMEPAGDPFRRQRRHIENVPVRQLIVIPEGSRKGYWLFESVGNRSLGEGYRKFFRREFINRYGKWAPRFEPLIAEEAWEAYTAEDSDAVVEAVRVVRKHASRDRAEELGIGDVPGQYIEMIVTKEKPQRTQRVLTAVRNKFFRRNDEGRWVPIDPEVTEVSATVRVGEQERQVVVDRDAAVRMRFPLDTPKDGAPSDSYFYSEARDVVAELADRDGVLLPADWRSGEWSHDPDFGVLGAQDGSAPAQ